MDKASLNDQTVAHVPASLRDRGLGIAGDAGEVVASVWVAFASG